MYFLECMVQVVFVNWGLSTTTGFLKINEGLTEHITHSFRCTIKGVQREEGTQLTINPTCEQKPKSQTGYTTCYLQQSENCTFPVHSTAHFGFCSQAAACLFSLYALGTTIAPTYLYTAHTLASLHDYPPNSVQQWTVVCMWP